MTFLVTQIKYQGSSQHFNSIFKDERVPMALGHQRTFKFSQICISIKLDTNVYCTFIHGIISMDHVTTNPSIIPMKSKLQGGNNNSWNMRSLGNNKNKQAEASHIKSSEKEVLAYHS